MNDIEHYFKQQLGTGVRIFFYGIEEPENDAIHIKSLKEDLTAFPSDLVYVRQMCEYVEGAMSIPVFRKAM